MRGAPKRRTIVRGESPTKKTVVLALLAVLAMVSCAESTTSPLSADGRRRLDLAELTTFEVRHDGVDRFEHCPPAGDIGQEWLPPVPEWKPAPAVTEGRSETAEGAPEASASPPPASQRELVDQAERATHAPFRHCYHDGLRFDPTQDGHVAVVLRVGPNGRVEAVETWGGCDIAPETITCLRDEAKHLRLAPPAAGYATVVVPGIFTEDHPRVRAANDGYTAASYVAVEATRTQLHHCEEAARREGSSRYARATMTIDVDASGHASHVSIDDWKGSQSLLACAAEVLRDASYPAPPTGRGRVIAPVAFNVKLSLVP
jgi:hypothetical protein